MAVFVTLFLSISLFVTQFTHALIPILHTSTSGKLFETDTDITDKLSTSTIANSDNSLGLTCGSALLMESSTGTIIYEKNATEQLRPASITKIMTLILIFDALAENRITLEDTVTVSEYASSMGGSQVYLEPGETQTVDTMIKCIAVASANDACVAMAEHVWGSETEFVNQMNERAKGLGMEQTTFVNCCGLDIDGHITTAKDIALMSRELITKYPDIFNYTTIWMENITHVTRRGTSEFGLTNTNKLIRHYSYATGLKTGFTSLAGSCISATAKKDGVELIAVIMKADSSKIRNAEAISLLNYGFRVCQTYKDANDTPLAPLPVIKGMTDTVPLYYSGSFHYVSVDGADITAIEKRLELPAEVTAPAIKGDIAGRAVYTLDGKEIGFVNILYGETVELATFGDYFMDVLGEYLAV
ncbi:MAG: D-alanyl-D-alanine carboxypeptidase [Lachnospiraceae bacterium]|nr:D-alanyl-D-alanine carboxypeptidase [Lachnospiraceae bacterium]